MKRILASLMAIVVGITATTSVVACGQKASRRTIDVKIGKNLKYTGDGSPDYNDNDFLKAYNGGNQSVYQIPLNALMYQVTNLFSLDWYQITNPTKIPDWRTTLIGMDEVKNEKGQVIKPSVDGLYFSGVDSGPTEFYNYYQQTSINSLGGLYQLYDAMKDKEQDLSQIGQGARDSYNVAKDVFSSEDGAAFINSFLSLNNQTANSSWLSATVDSDTTYKELDSKVLPFNQIKTGDGDKITELQFKQDDNPDAQHIGDPNTDFIAVNTVRADKEGHDNEKIGNRYKAIFDLLMLPTTSDIQGTNADKFDTSWSYPAKDDEEGQKAINPNKHWDIRTPENTPLDSLWSIKVDPAKSGNENIKGYIKNNESVIVPLLPVKIHFTYTTDNGNVKADKYAVDVTFEGLQAVFSPIVVTSDLKKDDKIANRYVKWQFTHYQFTDKANVITPPGRADREKAGFGNFSGMKISKIEITKTE